MAKLDLTRDYYADLELPVGADINEVKKQYRKLALKWHPDRNPGKEDEAKEKFLIISTAHEILTDPAQKAKVDAALRQRKARYPTASGVRGNPWANMAHEVNAKYGPPPQRPPMPTRPAASASASASNRYWDWGQKVKTKMDQARASSDAWERSRPQPKPASQPGPSAASAYRQSTARPTNPPPPPRSAAQARRQEASFGTRKQGFAPQAPGGDEPPVKNHHYTTTPKESMPIPPDEDETEPKKRDNTEPLSSQFRETFLDPRQRTPYAANVGERTNPFEPLNSVNRAKSMRDPGSRQFRGGGDDPARSPTAGRQRSHSVGNDGPFTRGAGQETSGNGARPSTFQNNTTNAPPTGSAFATGPSFQFGTRAAANNANGETRSSETSNMYGPPRSFSPYRRAYEQSAPDRPYPEVYRMHHSTEHRDRMRGGPWAEEIYSTPSGASRAFWQPSSAGAVPHGYVPRDSAQWQQPACSPTPSGMRRPTLNAGPNSFERMLHAQLQQVLAKAYAKRQPEQPSPSNPEPSGYVLGPKKTPAYRVSKSTAANSSHPGSFSSVPLGAATPETARFTRNSTDNINTQFVAEEKPGFHFSAGTPSPTNSPSDDHFTRAKQRARGHQSPLRNTFTASDESIAGNAAANAGATNNQQQAGSPKKIGDFKPDEWKELFTPHIFEPPQPSKLSSSPTRPIRPIKKRTTARAGASGMAARVESDSESSSSSSSNSSNSDETPRPTTAKTSGGIDGTRSPNAMDIDSPAAASPSPSPAAAPGAAPPQQANNARNVNVEPTKPEWRPGNVNNIPLGTNGTAPTNDTTTAEPKLGANIKIPHANHAGSEDTDPLLRPLFPDFRNTEPFAPPKPAGLDSFADLGSNLPFPSRPAAKVPISKDSPKKTVQLKMPSPPAAPKPPAQILEILASGAKPANGASTLNSAWISYTAEMKRYFEEWSAWNRRVTDHFAVRQRKHEDKGWAWVAAIGVDAPGVAEYLRAMEEDRVVREGWESAWRVHERVVGEWVALRAKVLG